jgi:hypothetical protein
MKHIQKDQKSIRKAIPAYGFETSQEKNPRTRKFLSNNDETHSKGQKSIGKSIPAFGF